MESWVIDTTFPETTCSSGSQCGFLGLIDTAGLGLSCSVTTSSHNNFMEDTNKQLLYTTKCLAGKLRTDFLSFYNNRLKNVHQCFLPHITALPATKLILRGEMIPDERYFVKFLLSNSKIFIRNEYLFRIFFISFISSIKYL